MKKVVAIVTGGLGLIIIGLILVLILKTPIQSDTLLIYDKKISKWPVNLSKCDSKIYTYNINNLEKKDVFSSSSCDNRVVVSDSGRKVAILSQNPSDPDDYNSGQIFIIDLKTKQQTQQINDVWYATPPAWSHNQKLIAYIKAVKEAENNPLTREHRLYVYNLENNEETFIASLFGPFSEIIGFLPDDNDILFRTLNTGLHQVSINNKVNTEIYPLINNDSNFTSYQANKNNYLLISEFPAAQKWVLKKFDINSLNSVLVSEKEKMFSPQISFSPDDKFAYLVLNDNHKMLEFDRIDLNTLKSSHVDGGEIFYQPKIIRVSDDGNYMIIRDKIQALANKPATEQHYIFSLKDKKSTAILDPIPFGPENSSIIDWVFSESEVKLSDKFTIFISKIVPATVRKK